MADNRGIEPEASYLYKGSFGICPTNNSAAFIKIGYTDYGYVTGEIDMKVVVATIGPIWISKFCFN